MDGSMTSRPQALPTAAASEKAAHTALQERDPTYDPERGPLDDTSTEVASSSPKEIDAWEVGWDGEDDPQNPLNMRNWKKWVIVFTIAGGCVCVTCCSSMAGMTYPGMEKEFGVSTEVCILSISLFVIGLGVGPLLLGPVSEFIGRKPVLLYGFLGFFLLNFPVAFGNNIAVHLIFRFLTGFAGSAYLSVSGGTIADIFHNTKVAMPMMIFSAAPFLGPVLGPLISGFINHNQPRWQWTYYVIVLWAFVMLILLVVFLPETFAPELLKHKARELRKATGEQRWIAPIEKTTKTFSQALQHSVKTPFILVTTQPMVLFLDLWSAILLGILYLSFGGIPYIFQTEYGFNMQETGMAFLGIGAGQMIAAATQPYFNALYARTSKQYSGKAPPEARLIIGMYGAVLAPIGLLLFGLTSWRTVHWIVPIVLSNFFGWGMVYAFVSTFTYLVDAYRPVAASALASNSFLRSSFAAGFPLFGTQMYRRLGSVGGTCLLAGLLFLCTPMPFVFYRIGARMRAKTPYAAAA